MPAAIVSSSRRKRGHSFAEKVRIKAYPVKEYLGLVFVYMGEGAAPELPSMPEMEADADSRRLYVHSRVQLLPEHRERR